MAVAGRLVTFLFHVLSVEFVDVNDFFDVKDLVDTNEERASSCGMSGDDWLQGCISCGILVSGIGARGVSSEHMENMEMFSLSPT